MEAKTIKPEIIIRYGLPADAALLSWLAKKCFFDTFGDHPLNSPGNVTAYMEQAFCVEKIESELNDANAIFLIAEIAGAVVGYAKLLIGSYESAIIASRPIELSRLYASQDHIGKGIGAALMQRCLDEAARRQHDVIWLGVWEHNERAQAFYRRWHFIEIGTHIFQLGSDAQTDLLMQRLVNL
jgi:ribosomal protein S18 acetylase RimI-like enzyme